MNCKISLLMASAFRLLALTKTFVAEMLPQSLYFLSHVFATVNLVVSVGGDPELLIHPMAGLISKLGLWRISTVKRRDKPTLENT